MVALPPVPPIVGWRTFTRLPRDHYVRIASNDYSVHPSAIGRLVEHGWDYQLAKDHRPAAGEGHL